MSLELLLIRGINLFRAIFENCGPGWIKTKFIIDDKEYTLFGSRLSDCISDFINSIILLMKGTNESRSKWQGEPGEYRVTLSVKENNLNIKVTRYDDTFSKKRDEEGTLEFEGYALVVDFIRNIIRGLDKLKNSISDNEYYKLWHYEFPHKRLEELRLLYRSL
jgi:mRNA-degrading endonuclease RelE of RelBE toxin-antitoxin system